MLPYSKFWMADGYLSRRSHYRFPSSGNLEPPEAATLADNDCMYSCMYHTRNKGGTVHHKGAIFVGWRIGGLYIADWQLVVSRVRKFEAFCDFSM